MKISSIVFFSCIILFLSTTTNAQFQELLDVNFQVRFIRQDLILNRIIIGGSFHNNSYFDDRCSNIAAYYLNGIIDPLGGGLNYSLSGMALDSNGNIIASTNVENHIFKYNGNSWNRLGSRFNQSFEVNNIFVQPTTNQLFISVGKNNTIFTYHALEETWIELFPQSNGSMAFVSQGFYLTINSTVLYWNEQNNNLNFQIPFSPAMNQTYGLLIDPTNGSLFLGSDSGLWRLTNFSNPDWTIVSFGQLGNKIITNSKAMIIEPTTSRIFFFDTLGNFNVWDPTTMITQKISLLKGEAFSFFFDETTLYMAGLFQRHAEGEMQTVLAMPLNQTSLNETEISAMNAFKIKLFSQVDLVLSNPCYWPYVECTKTKSSGDSFIQSIQVASLGLESGTLASEIALLKNLKSLEVHGAAPNVLTGTIPNEIFHMPNLRTLVLEGVNISGSFPMAVGSSSIEKFTLTSVNLTGAIRQDSQLMEWSKDANCHFSRSYGLTCTFPFCDICPKIPKACEICSNQSFQCEYSQAGAFIGCLKEKIVPSVSIPSLPQYAAISSSSSDNFQLMVAFALVVVVVVICVCFGMICFFVLRQRIQPHTQYIELGNAQPQVPSPLVRLDDEEIHELFNPNDNTRVERQVLKLRIIGEGGFGTVFKVKDIENKKFYAMKQAKPGRPLTNEAKQLLSLKHENIIKLIGDFWFRKEECDVLLLEFMEGGSLSTYMKKIQNRQLEFTNPTEIIRQIIVAVKYLHANDVVHRDLKPENILLQRAPPSWERIVLSDFGLSHTIGKDTRGSSGTKNYLPAHTVVDEMETKEEKDLKKWDLWALGCIICEMHFASKRLSCGEFRKIHAELIVQVKEPAKSLMDICWTNWKTSDIKDLENVFTSIQTSSQAELELCFVTPLLGLPPNSSTSTLLDYVDSKESIQPGKTIH